MNAECLWIVVLAFLSVSTLRGRAADCNENGLEDAEDVASGRSLDCNDNGEPDECDTTPRLEFPTVLLLPSGRRPIAVLAADLNGDRRSDLVALGSFEDQPGSGRHTVSIHFNSGRRSFEPPRRLYVPYAPTSPAAEDFDGDGDLDLAISHAYESGDVHNLLTFLRNDGSGSFSILPPVPMPGVPLSLTATDFDRDGFMDLAIALSRTREVRVFRGTGPFEFADTSFGVSRPPAVIVSADVNGDLAPDLLTVGSTPADRTGIVEVWVNDGAGSFSMSGSFETGEEPTDMKAADLDRDGDIDLAVVCFTSGEVFTFRNMGGGAYGEPTRMRVGNFPRSAAVGDLDGDQDLDLLVGDFPMSVAIVLENGGAGAFSPVRNHAVKTPFDLDLDDLDGDGYPEAISPFLDGDAAAVVWGGPGGRLQTAESHYTGVGTAAMEAGDLDGDGDMDIALGSNNPVTQRGRVSIMLGRAGGFEPPVHYDNGGYPNHLDILDVQGDGLADLVSANPFEGTMSVFESDGARLRSARKVPAGSFPIFLASLDLDGDAGMDVAVVNGSETGAPGRVTLLLGRNDGTFVRPGGFAVGPGPFALAGADLEGDGDTDLVVSGGPTSRLWSFENLGGLAFELQQDLGAGENPGYVGLADLNGDGRPDACLANMQSNELSVYMNLGDGNLGPEVRVRTGERPRSLDIADIDGDGDEDVLVANESSNSLSLLVNDGEGSLEPAVSLESGKQPIIVLARDNEGDGSVDVCAGNQNGLVTILRNASAPRSRDCDANTVPDECDLVDGAEDANENGLLDRCETTFRRGDPNQDGAPDLSDAVHVLELLFSRDEAFACEDAADTNDDGVLDISDPIFLLWFLLGDGPPPPPPAHPGACGVDPDPGDDDALGCESFESC